MRFVAKINEVESATPEKKWPLWKIVIEDNIEEKRRRRFGILKNDEKEWVTSGWRKRNQVGGIQNVVCVSWPCSGQNYQTRIEGS